MPRPSNPDPHHRQSIHLRGWDYTNPGAYFITICTYQRENLFDTPILSDLAKNAWRNIPTHPHACRVILDEWVVMPNHLHGILMLMDDHCRGEAGRKGISFAEGITVRPASPLHNIPFDDIPFDLNSASPHGVDPGSVGAIIGNFK